MVTSDLWEPLEKLLRTCHVRLGCMYGVYISGRAATRNVRGRVVSEGLEHQTVVTGGFSAGVVTWAVITKYHRLGALDT